MKITNKKDFWSGVMFITFGALTAGLGRQYEFGSAAEMGPGYFPTVVSVLLMALGLVVLAHSLSSKAEKEEVERFYFGTMFFILAPVVVFGALLNFLGLVLSLVVLVVFCSLAGPEFKLKEAFINAVALVVVSLLIFVWGLDMHLKLWPSFNLSSFF